MARLRRHAERGLSLPELMVVIAILGVVMAFGLPASRDLVAAQRMKTAGFNLVASVMFARGEAIKRGIPVYLAAPSANNLNNGWCVMVSNTAACSVSAPGVETMRIQQPLAGVTYLFKTAPGIIAFSRSGRLSARVNIEIADTNTATLLRCVSIDVAGNARSRKGACT